MAHYALAGPRAMRHSLRGIRRLAVACALGATSLSGCGGRSDTPQSVQPAIPPAGPSTSGPPFVTSGPYEARGEVFSFQTGVIAQATVAAWIQQGTGGFYGGARDSDGLGQFAFGNLPDGELWITGHRKGFVQPCAVREATRNNPTLRVEMLPLTAFDVPTAPPPQLAPGPPFTGSVVEGTADGARPVAGADVTAVFAMDLEIASTRTDGSGSFYLCNLPETSLDFYVGKDGYRTQALVVNPGAVNAPLRIQLTRN